MDRRRALVTLAALVLLALFLVAVGPRAVLDELRHADPMVFLGGCVAGLFAFVLWSEAQRRLHVATGADVRPGGYLAAYLAGAFGKLSLPAGQAGGPAVMAYALGTRTNLTYEEDLAAASVAKLLGALAATVPVLAGVLTLAVPSRTRVAALLSVAGVTAIAVVLVAVAARRPDAVTAAIRTIAAAIQATVGRLSGRVRRRTTPDRAEASLVRLRSAVAAVAADRGGLLTAFGLTVAGWLAYALPLAAGAAALGHEVPLALALFVVPVASLGTLVPLPSGLIGVELLAGGLLVALAGLDPPSAAAVVLLYRVATAVLPAVAGAAASVPVFAPQP